MSAGKYDHRVTIVRPGVVTRDAVNQAVAGVDVRTETWASVRPAPGTEKFASAENVATAPILFRFRWRADLVDVLSRIEHDDGRTYFVSSVTEIGRRKEIEVAATARAER